MGPFIQHLVDEHKSVIALVQKIQDTARSLKTSDEAKTKLMPLVQEAKAFINGVHHKKEEDILFPALFEQVPLQHGGPQCTHFMGLKLLHDPAEKLLQIGRQNNAPLPEHSPHIIEYKKKNSPLAIPIEEHEAGFTALSMVNAEIDKSEPSLSRIQNLVEQYVELIRLHSQKEDRCLFVLADEGLNIDIQTKLLKKALEITQKP